MPLIKKAFDMKLKQEEFTKVAEGKEKQDG